MFGYTQCRNPSKHEYNIFYLNIMSTYNKFTKTNLNILYDLLLKVSIVIILYTAYYFSYA